MTSSSARTLLNGIETDLIATADRGLQFGDGLFETIACRAGHLEYWTQHYARLCRDAAVLGITCPDESVFLQDIRKLVTDDNAACIIKIILTRGSGGRGYAITEELTPNRITTVSEPPVRPPELWSHGIRAARCKHRLSSNSQLAGIKHLNRLDNVLARKDLGRQFHEGIVYDQTGRPIEGTMSNLFCVVDGGLYTSAISDCGIDGIIRQRIISLTESANTGCHIGMTEETLRAAEEIFFCNSLIGIWPVKQLDDVKLVPGPVTRALIPTLNQDMEDNKLAVHN